MDTETWAAAYDRDERCVYLLARDTATLRRYDRKTGALTVVPGPAARADSRLFVLDKASGRWITPSLPPGPPMEATRVRRLPDGTVLLADFSDQRRMIVRL